jgi:cytochrome c oxidase subunit 2
MRMTGIKGLMLAAGLALAGVGAGHAAPPAATTAQPAASAAAPAAAPAAAQANNPLLAMDGAPAMTPVAHIGQPTDGVIGLQPQVTANGRFAHNMHDWLLFPVITVISVFVLFLLLWVIYRFRAAKNPVASKTSHNTVLEIAWTLLPVLILVGIAVPSIGLLQAQYKPAPKNAITLKVTGNQWFWSYEYPDLGDIQITANMLKEKDQVQPGERFRTDADGPRLMAVDNRVVLPVGVPIRLITTAADVIHSWAVPAFWVKLDAVPGRLNETSFTIEKPGLYFGQCSELCGARHGFMPIAVEAVPAAQFAAWVKAKGGTLPGQAAATPSVMPTPAAMAPASATPPTENATAVPPTSSQPATANPAIGKTGQ